MSVPGQLPLRASHDAVTQRAAEFFERQRFEDWNDTDQAELDAWMAESAVHRVAYLRLKAAVAHSEELFALDALEAKRAATPVARSGFNYRRFVIPLLAAASLAVVAVIGYPLLASWMQPPDRTDSTDVGGRAVLSFADNTQIELNTDTAMRFRMTTAERIVWLEKGEAWFHVAHDPKNPFTVVVGKHRITDIGTEFLVRRDGDSTTVTLLNGRAAFSAEGVQTAMLTPGDEAVATPLSLSITKRTPQELTNELAWRRGTLVFHNTPLSEVVREFNRYNRTKLAIGDPSIAGTTISAALKTNDYEGFLEMAEDVLKLHVDREGNVILISRGPREKPKAAHLKRGS